MLEVRSGSGDRRGVALMLVLVTVGVTVVLSGAVLTSRSQAPSMAENAVRAVQADWAAESAMNVAMASLSGSLDLSSVSGGAMMTSRSIAGATVNLTVTTTSGEAPTDDDHELIVTSEAVVNGVEVTTSRLVKRMPEADFDRALDLELGEFAIYAAGELKLLDTAQLRVWSLSPAAERVVKIGVGFESVGDLTVASGVKWPSARFYAPEDASSTLAGWTRSAAFGAGGDTLPADVPAVETLTTSAIAAITDRVNQPTIGDRTAGEVIDPSYIYEELSLGIGESATLGAPNATSYSFDRLFVNGGELVLADGVDVYVGCELVVECGGSIVLEGSGRSRIFVGGDVYIDNGTVGVPREIAEASVGGAERVAKLDSWSSPALLSIYGVSRSCAEAGHDQFGSSHVAIDIAHDGVVKAAIHAPRGLVTIRHGAALIGRVTAECVWIEEHGALHYCPTLDPLCAFTDLNGPLYDTAGDPLIDYADEVDDALPGRGIEDVELIVRGKIQAAYDAMIAASGGSGRSENEIHSTELAVSAAQLEQSEIRYASETVDLTSTANKSLGVDDGLGSN